MTETVGSEPAWHTAAQRCFPANIGEWALLTARDYQNALGEDRSVSYGAGDALASVYVYPEYDAALRGTAAARAEVRQVADQVEAVRWREHARVALPDTIGRGFVIVGEQPAQSFSEPRRRTLAAIWPADPWFVELRLTWTDLDAPWRPMLDEVMASAARPCVAPSEPPPELDFKTVLTIVPGGGPMTIHRTVFRVEQPGG